MFFHVCTLYIGPSLQTLSHYPCMRNVCWSFPPGPLPLSMYAHCVLVLLSRLSPILLLPLSVTAHSHINLCLLAFALSSVQQRLWSLDLTIRDWWAHQWAHNWKSCFSLSQNHLPKVQLYVVGLCIALPPPEVTFMRGWPLWTQCQCVELLWVYNCCVLSLCEDAMTTSLAILQLFHTSWGLFYTVVWALRN